MRPKPRHLRPAPLRGRKPAPDEPSFSEMAEALSLGVPFRIQMGADGRPDRFLRLGDGCLAMCGVTARAVLANVRALVDLIVPEDRHRLLIDRATFVAGRGPSSTELRIRRPDGELRWLRLVATERSGGLLDGLIVDVTEAKRMAEQLAEKRAQLETAIELTGMGVFQWDRDNPDVVVWSDRQYEIYGLPARMPITVEAFRDLAHPEDRARGRGLIAAALEGVNGGDCSFEHRIILPDGRVRWVLSHQRFRRDAKGLKSIHGATLDITDRRDAEERRRLQMRELSHRAKNAMTVMTAMVHQAARSADSVEGLAELLMSRLHAMARSQDLASASEGAPLQLPQLLAQVLEPFDLSRFDLDPDLSAVTVAGDGVVLMALLLHELATNAMKYGALSNGEGRVALSLSRLCEGSASIKWRERGGPRVEPPARQGFGTRLLATVLRGYGGAVSPSFAPDGFAAQIDIPSN